MFEHTYVEVLMRMGTRRTVLKSARDFVYASSDCILLRPVAPETPFKYDVISFSEATGTLVMEQTELRDVSSRQSLFGFILSWNETFMLRGLR